MSDVLDERPTELPPGDAGAATATTGGVSAPTLLTPAVVESALAAERAPTLTGPSSVATEDRVTAATCRSGQVTALWSVDEARNAWMQVSGVGWRKLYNGRDGAFTALLILASQARQTGRTIQFREEADGMVYEIYLW